MSRFIQDAEKAQLQRTVQEGDRTLDPSQSEAWAVDGTFQIGDFPPVVGPKAIAGFLAGFFTQGFQDARARAAARPRATGGDLVSGQRHLHAAQQ
ncbi:MAG: hypothetical protein IPI49_12345 [Myxococcales bacterium]|nr:hypothetical protein [Myxococcales bacterium]